jgi:hypothetical protein
MKSLRAIYLALLTIGCVVTCPVKSQQSDIQWHRIASEYYNFVKSPIGTSALPLIALLPKTDLPYTGNESEQQAKTYIYDNLLPLEARILKGDQQSIRLGFCLYPISGGDFTETLDIILGESIRPYAKLFLSELKNAKLIAELLPGLLGNCGDAFVDKPEAERKELRQRLRAIQQVHNPELQTVRQRCVDELVRQVNKE